MKGQAIDTQLGCYGQLLSPSISILTLYGDGVSSYINSTSPRIKDSMRVGPRC